MSAPPLECADPAALWIDRTLTGRAPFRVSRTKDTQSKAAPGVRTPKWVTRLWTFVIMCGACLSASADDVILLEDGKAMRGEIVRYYENTVHIKVVKEGESGEGFTVRQIPDTAIRLIDYAPNDAEAKIIASGDAKALRDLWRDKEKLLMRPNSNAGEVALALAESLIKLNATSTKKSALDLFSSVESDDWNRKRQITAKRGRLRTLIALGDIDSVIQEATEIAEVTEDPDLLLDARHVLAVTEFQKLEKLIDDNPKWREDDEVMEEIRNLYNRTANSFLEPYLFYGSNQDAAARGLIHAARTHKLAGNPAEAKACAEDILKLYKNTSAADAAQELITELEPTNDAP